MSNIDISEFKLPATDGFELAASLYQPAESPPEGAVVLVLPATGVKRSYYDKYARFLAAQGFITLTCDYRGIGGSRPRTLKGFEASLDDWVKDIAGAIDRAAAEQPRRLLVVAHSIGGQLIGLVPNSHKVNAMLAVAVQSGYWGLWSGSRRYFMWFLWHVLMPGLTAIFSYFPSTKLGFGEDLPGGVARQWAFWGRHPHYIVDAQGNPIREGFLKFTAPIRSYSFTDDVHAPRAAVESLVRRYENAPKEWSHIGPKDLGARAIGHFGFFRDKFRSSLWAESAEWLKRQAVKAPAAAERAAR